MLEQHGMRCSCISPILSNSHVSGTKELLAAAERRRIAKASADRMAVRGLRAGKWSDSRLDESWLRSLLAAAAATRWR